MNRNIEKKEERLISKDFRKIIDIKERGVKKHICIRTLFIYISL